MMSPIEVLNTIIILIVGALIGLFAGIYHAQKILDAWKASELGWIEELRKRGEAHIEDTKMACRALKYVIDTGKLSKEEIAHMNEIFQGRADYDLPTRAG